MRLKAKPSKLPVTKGKQVGKGLKPGLNDAMTGSVVHKAKTGMKIGRLKYGMR